MKKYLLTPLILTVCASLAACAPTVNARGNMIKDYQLVTMKAGVTTKNDVLRALGSPTTQDPFDENTWYYIGQKTEKKGILDPKVVEERIIMVNFDPETGIVNAIQDVGGNREDIPYENRKTPTSGNEITVLQQFFGNLGKFNAASELNKK